MLLTTCFMGADPSSVSGFKAAASQRCRGQWDVCELQWSTQRELRLVSETAVKNPKVVVRIRDAVWSDVDKRGASHRAGHGHRQQQQQQQLEVAAHEAAAGQFAAAAITNLTNSSQIGGASIARCRSSGEQHWERGVLWQNICRQ